MGCSSGFGRCRSGLSRRASGEKNGCRTVGSEQAVGLGSAGFYLACECAADVPSRLLQPYALPIYIWSVHWRAYVCAC